MARTPPDIERESIGWKLLTKDVQNRINGATRNVMTLVRTFVSDTISRFIHLSDVPGSYSGKASYVPRVKSAEDGLDFDVKLTPADGQLPYWDADELKGSRADTSQPEAVVTVKWEGGDMKPSFYAGAPDSGNNQDGLVGESDTGAGVFGNAGGAAAMGVKGTAGGANGIGVYGEATAASGWGGYFRNTNAAPTSAAIIAGNSVDAGYSVDMIGGVKIWPIRAINANLTVTRATGKLSVSTVGVALTITLPTLSADMIGWDLHILDVGNNTGAAGRAVTVNTAAANTFIGGATTKALASSGGRWILSVEQDNGGTMRWYLNGPIARV